MAEEQKSTAIAWVQVLTPIMLAMIGLILPFYKECNCSNRSASDVLTPLSEPVTSKQDVTVIPPKEAAKPFGPPKSNRQDSIIFKGKVVSIYESTGIKGAKVKIGTITTQTDEKGTFQIKILKNVNKFLINADHRMFQSNQKEFSPSQSGSATIQLRPK